MAARGYEQNVREKVLPEPGTERQKTTAALRDSQSGLRYLNLEKPCARQEKVASRRSGGESRSGCGRATNETVRSLAHHESMKT